MTNLTPFKQNKQMWFHRRLFAYISLFMIFIESIFLFFFVSPDNAEKLKWIYVSSITGWFLIILFYIIFTFLHDTHFFPTLLQYFDKQSDKK